MSKLPIIIHEESEEIPYAISIKNKKGVIQIKYKSVSFEKNKKKLKKLGLHVLVAAYGNTWEQAEFEMLHKLKKMKQK